MVTQGLMLARRGYGGNMDNAGASSTVKPGRKEHKRPPQETVQQYWEKFNTQYPGKVYTVLPENSLALGKPAISQRGIIYGQRASKSYEEAKLVCIKDVNRIVRECRRMNQKYRDLHFDIELDLKLGHRNCLDGLSSGSDGMKPKGVKRVTDIFEAPKFFITNPRAESVRQGRDGDCYLIAALSGLSNMQGLINKVCVKYDQQIGVYGFVFYRDGEWQPTIIDDQLYLKAPDYEEAQEERRVWDNITRVNSEEEYRKAHLTGSRALYFAQCEDENETWLPLLEKAFAKAHGDFSAIDGGFTGEAIEDLTGGVTSEVYSTDILDKNAFWKEELCQVGKKFLFGCATGILSNWLDTAGNNGPRERLGIDEGHAYSIIEAREVKGHKLLKVRNPWGSKEWEGRWSDGSAEWDAEMMQLLNHKFGNDGVFWISYADLLKKYQHFDRTRIFGPEWNISQCWTSVNVPWSAEYLNTKFSIELKDKATLVIVLSQLDDSYFRGLEGVYGYTLQFRLEDDNNEDPDEYIVHSNASYAMTRSVNTEVELEAGTYSVLMKITATRDQNSDVVEDILPVFAATRREKLIRMAQSYDLAHAKGIMFETKEDCEEHKERAKIKKAREREELKERTRLLAEKHWKRRKAMHERDTKRRKNKERTQSRQLARDMRASRALMITDVGKGLEKEALHSEIPMSDELSNIKRTETPISMLESGTQLDMIVRLKSAEKSGFAKLEIESADEESTGPMNTGMNSRTEVPNKESNTEKLVEKLEDLVRTPMVDSSIAPVDSTRSKAQVQQHSTVELAEDKRTIKAVPTSKSSSSSTEQFVPTPTSSASLNVSHIQRENTNRNEDSDSVSEADSFPPFDWDSELDMPSDAESSSSSSSDSETDSDSLDPRYHRPSHCFVPYKSNSPAPPDPTITTTANANGDSTDDVDGPEEPWNAVCVVGLRVYTTLAADKIAVRVVRPPSQESIEEDRKQRRFLRRKERKNKGMNNKENSTFKKLASYEAGKGSLSTS